MTGRARPRSGRLSSRSPIWSPPTAEDGSRTENVETWELLNEEMRQRLDVQRGAAARLETKAAVVIGAALTAVQFVAKEPVRSYWLPAAVVAYATAMGAGLFAVLPRAFDEIGPRSMLVGLWLFPRGRAAAELANNRYVAYQANARRHGRRVDCVRVAIVALIAGGIMSVVHLTEGVRPHVGGTTTSCASTGALNNNTTGAASCGSIP